MGKSYYDKRMYIWTAGDIRNAPKLKDGVLFISLQDIHKFIRTMTNEKIKLINGEEGFL